MITVSATDPDTPSSSLMTSYSKWTLYDAPFNDLGLNKDTPDRFIWTQKGPNPQDLTLNAKLNDTNLPSGVYKVTFFANDGMIDGPTSAIYFSIDNPAINDRPYIKEIPSITLHENDQTVINLDDFGIDPDRNKDKIGRINYNLVSVNPKYSRIMLCRKNPLTNNINYILSITPSQEDLDGALSKTVAVTIRATDGGKPGLSFDRTFNVTILRKAGDPVINNPSKLKACTDEDNILEIESATITSLPQVFNFADLNIPDISKAILSSSEITQKYISYLSRVLNKKKFEGNLVVGGRAYIGLELKPGIISSEDDLKSLAVTFLTELDNQEYQAGSKVVSFDQATRSLLIEVKLPDSIPPGNATLLLNRTKDENTNVISRTSLTILPALIAKSITEKELIGKPQITNTKLMKLPSKAQDNKKQYLLVLTGHNFLKRTVNINKTLIVSPIVFQPFSLITFTDKTGITIKRMRVTRNQKDIRRTKMEIIFEYDDTLSKDKDIRYFTVSTLVGQDIGSVDLKAPQGKGFEKF
ncbi:MAG: hypothetical protein HY094_10625 [Candidatus Melainabacteria bacterium]|nr:hypothetical protein [Candidatus Melainabacteria bacterium]